MLISFHFVPYCPDLGSKNSTTQNLVTPPATHSRNSNHTSIPPLISQSVYVPTRSSIHPSSITPPACLITVNTPPPPPATHFPVPVRVQSRLDYTTYAYAPTVPNQEQPAKQSRYRPLHYINPKGRPIMRRAKHL
ncbi:hypothetical protein K439DRAFT_1640956 [Ramaria rubella]|nr:hypothetical protein K439DRAFT_1640956 [Ramaria rubella]